MNIKNIRALAQILVGAGLTALEVTEGEEKIRLEKTPAPVAQQPATWAVESTTLAAVQPSPVPVASAGEPTQGVVDFNELSELKSPMVGIYYNAPTPDAKPFVQVGDRVKKGEVLCIIEAMKLMNEIAAEIDGEIVDICVENGQLVEFGQCLFKIF